MEYYEIIGLSIMAAVAFLYSCFKKGFAEMLTKWFSHWFKEKFEGEQINHEFNSIFERLIELRTKLGADRVFIDQFHNGAVFSNNKPIWKITRTYEICASGVSYESLNMQGVMAITIWDTITAIFDNKMKKYCERLQGTSCDVTANGCRAPFGVYKYNVSRMPECFGKILLRNQGVDHYLQVPIIQQDKNVTGFVGIQYLDECCEEIDPCYICQKVQEISYFLNKE